MADTPDWCYEIGEHYAEEESVPLENTEEVEQAYNTMTSVNKELYAEIPVPVIFQSEDPYDNYEDMKETVEKEEVLRIFTGGNPPDNMTEQENWEARAVHDWHGHLSYDVNFSLEGEFWKWYRSTRLYPPEVTQLLFAEVVCQISAYYYKGGFDFEQRDIIAPSEWIEQACDYYDMPVPHGTYYWDTEE